jgi:hypothetical protein
MCTVIYKAEDLGRQVRVFERWAWDASTMLSTNEVATRLPGIPNVDHQRRTRSVFGGRVVLNAAATLRHAKARV